MKNLVSNFLEDLALQGKTLSTCEEYENRLNDFLAFIASKQTKLQAVTQRDMRDYRTYLLKKKLNNRTINMRISTVRVFYNWAQINEIVDTNPVLDGLHLVPKDKRIERLTDQEIRTFLSWINTLQGNLRTAFYLMYGSGARVGEVANLTAADVVLKDNNVYITITDAKWGSDRVIPIMDKYAAKIVWQYRLEAEITSQPLFRLSRRTLQTYATNFSQQTGIKFHCHLLRHTFAARLLEMGIPITTIQYLLGHKTLNMTAHYTQSARIDVSAIAPTIFQERGTQQYE